MWSLWVGDFISFGTFMTKNGGRVKFTLKNYSFFTKIIVSVVNMLAFKRNNSITVLVLRNQHQNFGGKLTKVDIEVC